MGEIMQKALQPGSTQKQKEIYYFLTYGLCFVALGLGSASLGPLLPTLADTTRTSLAQISFLFTATSLGYMVGSTGGGRLYDRVNGHKLMIIALGLMFVIYLLIPMLPGFEILLIAMFIAGLGSGSVDIGGNVNLLWVFESRVGPFMNGLHFCFGLGAFLSPMIIHNVMKLSGGGLTWPYRVLALAFIPGMIGLSLLRAPENPEKDLESQSSGKTNTLLVGLMLVLFFLYVAVEGGFGGWIFTYATEVNVASETSASYMNSFFWGALTLGRLLSVYLAKKLTPAKILLGNFSFAILSLGLILIWPTSKNVVWLVSISLGFALSSVFPTLMALSETRMKVTGTVTSMFFLGVSLGGIIMPMLLGQIFDFVGSYYIMVALFATACLGLLVLISVLLTSNRVGEKTRV